MSTETTTTTVIIISTAWSDDWAGTPEGAAEWLRSEFPESADTLDPDATPESRIAADAAGCLEVRDWDGFGQLAPALGIDDWRWMDRPAGSVTVAEISAESRGMSDLVLPEHWRITWDTGHSECDGIVIENLNLSSTNADDAGVVTAHAPCTDDDECDGHADMRRFDEGM